jgi:alpha-galactosidase
MMGKLGYDLQVKGLTEQELAFSQQAIANYKRLSNVIWRGDLYRMISPYEENRAVLMYINPEKSKAVLFSYTLNSRFGESFNKVRLQGLDSGKIYSVKEINLFPGIPNSIPAEGITCTGEYLMKVGLNVSSNQALTSSVVEITAL